MKKEDAVALIHAVCPQCGADNEIPSNYLGKEVVCPLCRGDYVAEATIARPAFPAPTAEGYTDRDNVKEGLPILVAITTPIFSAMLIYFWIGQMNMLQGPASKLALVLVLTVWITAIAIGADALNLGIGSESRRGGLRVSRGSAKSIGAVGFAVAVVFLWVVFYPFYFHYRTNYGGKNYVILSLLGLVCFLVSAFIIGGLIGGGG